MPFDSKDIIRQSGYQTGDVLMLAAIPGTTQNERSTTSTTFVAEASLHRLDWQWDRLIPDGATGVCALSGQVLPGTDETYDVRIQNVDDGETAVDSTGHTSSTKIHTNWAEYTPTTTGSRIRFVFQHKTDPGSASSTTRTPIFYVGAKL